ncbi:putative FHA domain containing protein [Lyophyllum shimeji]|uniref:FHA domain containing protein n=1 Tax=Lyophyllum shimeji TaxID=47721 RepID=A0A9P3UN68_LYOSH|nr:putative FHA domain containing protein [Lyophyllum shimeji]
MLSLSAVAGSFPFPTKYIPLSLNVKITLGAAVDADSGQTRDASPTNGWFAPQRPPRSSGGSPVSPLPLSPSHSVVWWDGQQVYIRDLDSPFGTYVNDVKIKTTKALKTNDMIRLGSSISRNSNTPGDITDEQLKPIIAKVTLAGISSS